MKNGPQISPVVAVVVIVVALAIAGWFLFSPRFGAHGGAMSADKQAEMRKYMAQQGLQRGGPSPNATTGGSPRPGMGGMMGPGGAAPGPR